MNVLSPVSVNSNDWSPTGYQAYNQGPLRLHSNSPIPPRLPDTPPVSSHASASTSTTDGGMQAAMSRRRPSNGNPSPPSSVAGSVAGSNDGSRRAFMEEQLSEHYRMLKGYLAPYLQSQAPHPQQNRARDKLIRLSSVQFQELSTDVYDEMLRREEDRKSGGPASPGNSTPRYLLPRPNFHFKRNQARQKLSTAATDRFRQLATDVFYELERRFPPLQPARSPDSRPRRQRVQHERPTRACKDRPSARTREALLLPNRALADSKMADLRVRSRPSAPTLAGLCQRHFSKHHNT